MGYNYQQDALAVGRTNGEASSTIPKRRVVAAVGTSTTDDLVGLLVSGNVAKMYGVSGDSDIAAGKVGDVYIDGIVAVESDGSAVINFGDKLTASTTADATQGRVKTAAPGAGVNSEIIGIAETYAPATAGYVVMVRIQRFTLQG